MTDNDGWACECEQDGKRKRHPHTVKKCPKCAFTPDTEYYPKEKESK